MQDTALFLYECTAIDKLSQSPDTVSMKKILKRIAYHALRIVGFVIIKSFFGIEMQGMENIPRKGAYILVSNHISYIDPVAVHAISRRQMRFFMAADWYNDKRWKWFYDFFGCIPVEESRINPGAVTKAIEVITGGDPFVIFPEGGISGTGKMQRWHPGVGLLALSTGVPVIPVIVKGTSDVLPRGSRRIYCKPMSVFAGEKLVFNVARGTSFSQREMRAAAQKIRNAFIELARVKGLYGDIIGPEAEEERIDRINKPAPRRRNER